MSTIAHDHFANSNRNKTVAVYRPRLLDAFLASRQSVHGYLPSCHNIPTVSDVPPTLSWALSASLKIKRTAKKAPSAINRSRIDRKAIENIIAESYPFACDGHNAPWWRYVWSALKIFWSIGALVGMMASSVVAIAMAVHELQSPLRLVDTETGEAAFAIIRDGVTRLSTEAEIRSIDLEAGVVLAATALEFSFLLAVFALHAIQLRLNVSKLYIPRALLKLGRFSSFEMLKLWNPSCFYSFLTVSQDDASAGGRTLVILLKVFSLMLGALSPLTVTIELRRLSLVVLNGGTFIDAVSAAGIFINFVGMLSSSNPRKPWMLSQRHLRRAIDAGQFIDDQHYHSSWENLWDECLLSFLGPRHAILFILSRAEE